VAEFNGKLVLTPTQVRLLTERTTGPGPRPLVVALELDGPVDADRLDEAWQEVQRRHPFLRLRLDSSRPYASDDVRPLVRGDIPGARQSYQTDLARILAAATRPRDFSVEGPAEGVLIRTGPEASTLVCSIDHLAIDGWSFNMLAREWSALYNGKPLPPPIDPLPVIEKYNEAQHNSLEKEIRELREEFAGAEPFALPHSLADWALQEVELPRDVAIDTRRAAAKKRSTAFAFVLAALGRALTINHGTQDVIVSTHVANRVVPQSESVVCAAYNTVPIRLSAACRDDINCWIAKAKEASLRALRRQHVPFALVHQVLAPRISREALSRVMLTVDEHPFIGFVLPGVRVSEAAISDLKRLAEGPNAPLFSTSSRPWPAGITVSFRETWESLQLYVHYGQELGHRGATMLLGRVTEGLALLTDSNN